jgi:serine/threonine-protein kinase
VLYELLTLRRLYKRATPLATLKAISEEPVVPPSRLSAACPKALDLICLRALARDPGQRYATAADMRQDLLTAMRATGGEGLPEDRLAETMLRIFADRKQEKEEMLRRVREGDRPTGLPSAEADDAVEIPAVDVLRSSRRSRRIGVAMITVIVAVFSMVTLASRRTPLAIKPTPNADRSPSPSTSTPQLRVSAESVPPASAAVPTLSADHRVKARAPVVPTPHAKVDADPLHTKW